MLKIWYVSTYTYVVSENLPFSTNTTLVFVMSAFFCKTSAFFTKNSPFTRSNIMRAVLEIFLVLFLRFVRLKVTINENVSFANYAFGIRPPEGSKLAINKKKMTSQFADLPSLSNFFNVNVFLLSSLVTGPSFISIS